MNVGRQSRDGAARGGDVEHHAGRWVWGVDGALGCRLWAARGTYGGSRGGHHQVTSLHGYWVVVEVIVCTSVCFGGSQILCTMEKSLFQTLNAGIQFDKKRFGKKTV